VTVLLFCYGVGGAIGNFAGGRATDRWGSRKPLLVVTVAITAVMALLPLTTATPVAAGISLFVWGLATWSFNPPVQHRLIELSPGHAGLVLSLNASAIYLGVGLSGIVGGAVLATGGPLLLPEVAAALTLVALLLVGSAWGRVREPREQVAV